MVYQRPVLGQGEPFTLKSIRKEQPPAGVEGIDWHRYVITQADNTIVGHRQGSTSSVRLAIEEIVLHLNERRVRYSSHTVVKPPPFPIRKEARPKSSE